MNLPRLTPVSPIHKSRSVGIPLFYLEPIYGIESIGIENEYSKVFFVGRQIEKLIRDINKKHCL